MYCWIYGLWKTWLDDFLKTLISEDPLTSNMGNGLKHCWNHKGSTFTIFIDYCERYWVGKSLFQWYKKYSDCFLTHWLPITSILFLIETVYCKIFRYNYLRNKNIFSDSFLIFENFDWILKIFNKKSPS